jgi:hypothetical protein
MTLGSIHARLRGTGGTYDDLVDTLNRVPGVQRVGQAYMNWAMANPGKERVLNGYVALDAVANSGDATVMGAHELAKDANPSFIVELTDPIGNPFDLTGGMIEEGGESINYEGIEMLGSGIEGFGEFISDPIESTFGDGAGPEWYDNVAEDLYDGEIFGWFGGGETADGAANMTENGTDAGTTTDTGGAATETGDPTDTQTETSTDTATETQTETTTEEPTPTATEVDYQSIEQNLDAQDREAIWEYLQDAAATHEVDPDSVYLDDPENGYDINVEGYSGDRELSSLDGSESEYLEENLDRIVELWMEDPDRY